MSVIINGDVTTIVKSFVIDSNDYVDYDKQLHGTFDNDISNK